MRKKLLQLAIVAFMLTISSMLAAQSSVLTEDFESGMPTSWQVTPTTGVTPWTVSTSGISGVTAYSGTKYLSLYTTNQQTATKLLLPMVNVSTFTTPEVSFFLVQKARGANANNARDTLKIYGRATASAQWTLLATYDSEVTSWTKKTLNLSTYANGSVQLAFEYNYGAGLGLAIDDIRIGEELVCGTPTNLRTYRVSATSAQLMWDVHESATTFGLKVSTTSLTNPSTATADVINDTIYSNPYMVTGLTANTTYYYYVNANCGGDDVSPWSGEGVFTTRCNAVNIPYSQDFNGGGYSDFHSCWSKHFTAEGNWVSTPTAATYTPALLSEHIHGNSGQAMKLYAYWYDDDEDVIWTTTWATTPEINVTDINTVQARFYAYTTDKNDILHLGVMSDPDDEASFEEVWEIHFTQEFAWEEIIIPISNVQATSKYIAFKVDAADRSTTSSIYIDDLVIEAAPACPTTTTVTARNITSTTATLAWLGTAPSWDVKVSSTSLANPATDAADIFSGAVNGNTKALANLTPGTAYYAYVQPGCATSAAWSNEYMFVTKPGIAEIPYMCDFETSNSRYQWSFIDRGCANVWRTGTAVKNGGTYSLYVTLDNGATFDYNSEAMSLSMAATQIRFTPGEYEISFDYKCIGEDGYDKMFAFLAPENVNLNTINQCGVPAGCINLFGTLNKSNVRNWTNEYKVITVSDTTVYSLVFQWDNDETSANGFPGAVDNIVVTNRNCISPDTVIVSNILQQSANATWNVSELNETAWDVRLATEALATNDAGTVLDTTVNDTTLQLTGLTAATTYYLYVRSNCGADRGRWTLVNFTTACGDITTLPYTESFTVKDSPTLPNCWTDVQNTGCAYDSREATGNEGFSMRLQGILSAPRFNVQGTPFSNMMLSVKCSSMGASSNIEVGVMTNPNDATTFVPADTITTTINTWDKYVALFGANLPATGYLAFRLQNTTAAMVFIDDIELIARPACLPVTHIAVDSLKTNSVTLSWTEIGNATSWDIAVTPNGGDPATVTATNYNTNPATITGLNDGEKYDIFVRANCGTGSVSTWESISIATPAIPATAPYVSNFETDSARHGWTFTSNSQNVFTIGNAVCNGVIGGNGLYMSNNGDYDYNENATTNAYAYRDIVLEPGVYVVSYDWIGRGETNFDYALAFIAPVSTSSELNTATTLNPPASWTQLHNNKMVGKTNWETCTKNVTITHRGVYRLIYYWRNDNSGTDGDPIAIDNVSVVPAGGCINVDALAVTFNNQDATISWAASDSASYRVKVSNTLLATPTTSSGDIADTLLTGNSLTVHNLAAASTYYVYVQVICPDETKPYYSESFTTPCKAVNIYTEDFEQYENAQVPTCWTIIGNSKIYGVYPPQGMLSFCFMGGEQWAALPAMASDIHSTYAEFDYIVESLTYSGTLTIGVMSDPNDITTFEPVQTLTATTNSSWQHANISFANTTLTGTGRYIAFHQVGSAGYRWCIDNITAGEYRSCSQPESVVATGITTDGANLSWATSNANKYTVVIATTPVEPDSVDENTADVFYLTDITTNSVDLTSLLTESTRYYVYVQGDCGNGTPSFWSKEYSFVTACSAVTIPFIDNFNSNPFTPNQPSECWTVQTEFNGNITGEYARSAYGTVAIGTDTCYVMKAYYGGTNQSKVCAAVPSIVASYDTLQLSFRHKGTTTGSLLVGFVSDANDPSTFTVIDTVRFGNAWTNQLVALRNHNADNQQVAFLLSGEQNMASKICYIDDVVISKAVSCQAPLNVTAVSTIGEEATVSLRTISAADQTVQIRISTTLANGDNAIDAIPNFVVDTIVNVANLPLHVNGLTPLTQYNVYARVCCGTTAAPAYSAYSDVCTFSTPCGNFPIPYVNTFATGIVYGTPQCWARPNNSSMPTATTGMGSDDNNCLRWYYSGTIALPNLSATSLQALTVYFKLYSQAQDTVELGIMSDINDAQSFQTIGSYHPAAANTWEEFSVNLASFTGNAGRLAFRSNSNICLDELYVDYTSACARPTNLTAANPTTTSIDLTWTPAGNETSWEVVVVPQGNSPSTGNIVTSTTTSITINNLPAGAGMTAFVRAACGANDVSAWSSAATFQTQRVATALPFTSDFEDNIENSRWEFVNGTNAWYIGTAATANNSANGMYISNSNGATNAYTTNATTLSIAYRYFHIEQGTYEYHYDWKANGEGGYDFLRVALIPDNIDINTISSPGAYATPTNWIALDNGQLYGKSTWQTVTNFVEVPTGNYYLAFIWVNDYSSGTQAPAAVDNISLRIPECYFNEVIVNAFDTSLEISGTTDCATGDILVYDNANTSTSTPIATANNVALPYTVNGLQPQTQYYIMARGYCDSGDTTEWVNGTAKTACGAINLTPTTPYYEGFESFTLYTTPDCWTQISTNTYYAPNVVDDVARTGNNSLFIFGDGNNPSYIATPLFNVDSLSKYRVSFAARPTNDNMELQLGIMTNPSDPATFTLLGTIIGSPISWDTHYISLSSYTGNGKYIALRKGVNDSGIAGVYYIDDFTVEAIPACAEPISVTASKINGNSANITIAPAQVSDAAWNVKISTTMLNNMASNANILDTVVDTVSFAVNNLLPSTTYYVYVTTACGANQSNWVTCNFTTACAEHTLPFVENFGTDDIPNCWEKYAGLISDAFAGNAPTPISNGWDFGRQNVVWSNKHAYFNIYGTSRQHWLVSPQIIIDTTAMLTFDIALTGYNTTTPVVNPNGQPDDKFVVLVSKDDGETWNQTDVLAEWNSTSTTYSYGNISNTGEHVSFLLNQYIGDTIRLAFYGESTATNGDNDLHLNNVAINRITTTTTINDSVCDGYNYTNNGFNISNQEIANSNDKQFSRIAGDTMYVVTLTVNPSYETVINATICQGETYTLNGFNTSTAGTYYRYLTSQNGCDSVITLNLTVGAGFVQNDTVNICQSQLPYLWNGQACNKDSVYTHRVATATGCDSIFNLVLHVNAEYNINDTITITDAELPYTYGDTIFNAGTKSGVYVFNYLTEAGCDSVINLYLSVTSVGLDFADDELFAITPNPAHRGEVVRIDLRLANNEREGVVVELFNNAGALIERTTPKEDPIYITMPHIDGLYLVRVTTTNGRVLYGKVIVK